MIGPNLSDEDLARELIALLPGASYRALALVDVECGEPFGATVMAVADLVALRIAVPAGLVAVCKQRYPIDDDILTARLHDDLDRLAQTPSAA